jgi:hypothetical protein
MHLANARRQGEQGDFAGAVKELTTALDFIPENADAKRLIQDYTVRQRQAAQQQEARHAQERTAEEQRLRSERLRSNLETACQNHTGGACLGRQEVVSKKDVKATAEAIVAAMRDIAPKFDITDYEESQTDTFLVKTKQEVSDGSRMCIIVGGQFGTNTTLVSFKVLEFQKSHSYDLLGGLITAKVSTPSDRNGQREARFEMRKKEGYTMVRARIEKAVE